MSGPAEPALTPEQWAARECPAPGGLVLCGDSPDAVTIESVGMAATVSVRREGLHALTALALHGQSFGFTHRDVTALRIAARDAFRAAGDVGPMHAGFELGTDLTSIADRIAALLPPKEV